MKNFYYTLGYGFTGGLATTWLFTSTDIVTLSGAVLVLAGSIIGAVLVYKSNAAIAGNAVGKAS